LENEGFTRISALGGFSPFDSPKDPRGGHEFKIPASFPGSTAAIASPQWQQGLARQMGKSRSCRSP
jgi:hypothetical protein